MAPRKTNKATSPQTRPLRDATMKQRRKRLSRVARARASPKAPKSKVASSKVTTPGSESPTRLTMRIPPLVAHDNNRDIPVAPSTVRRSPLPMISAPAHSFQAMSRSPPRDRHYMYSAPFFVYPPPPALDKNDPEWLDVMYEKLETNRRSLEEEVNQLWEDMTAVCAQVNLASYRLALEKEEFDGYLEIIKSIAGMGVVQDLLVLVEEEMRESREELQEQGRDDEPAREQRPRGSAKRDIKGKGRAMDQDYRSHSYKSDAQTSGRRKRGREAQEDVLDPNFEEDIGLVRSSKRRRGAARENSPSSDESSSLPSRHGSRSTFVLSSLSPRSKLRWVRGEPDSGPDWCPSPSLEL